MWQNRQKSEHSMKPKILIATLLSLCSFALVSMYTEHPHVPHEKKTWVVDARDKPAKPFYAYCHICGHEVNASRLNDFMEHLLNAHKEDNIKIFKQKEKLPNWWIKYSYER